MGTVRYELNPRSKIFRRDAGKIEDRAAMKAFMRYNDWQHDPFSRAGYGGPTEGQSAENAIALAPAHRPRREGWCCPAYM